MKYSKLLSGNGFFMVNKNLAKYLKSNDSALVLVHLLSLQEEYFDNKPFYQQQERILEECNVTLYSLRKIVEQLIREDLLVVTKQGMPSKNYYHINTLKVKEIVEQELELPESSMITTTTEMGSPTPAHNKSIENSVLPTPTEMGSPTPAHLGTTTTTEMGTTTPAHLGITKKKLIKEIYPKENKVKEINHKSIQGIPGKEYTLREELINKGLYSLTSKLPNSFSTELEYLQYLDRMNHQKHIN